ncbi:MAG: hypothetical protein SOW80_04655 [Anaerovoracaceae bacterium]|nr:hypothetical protein [Anaerovoracaceae bacterium]
MKFKIPERPFEDQVKKEMDAYKRKLAEGKTENHDEEERKNRRIRVAFCLVIAAFGVFIITWGIRAL